MEKDLIATSESYNSPTSDLYIGIDNGLEGGAVALDAAGTFIGKYRFEKYPGNWGNQIHSFPLVAWLTQLIEGRKKSSGKDERVFIMVEEPLSGYGGKTTARTIQSTGISFGKIVAAVEMVKQQCSNVFFQTIDPQKWQSSFFKSGGDSKAKSIHQATSLFPKVDFRKSESSKKIHDGFADAALIAEHARRNRC